MRNFSVFMVALWALLASSLSYSPATAQVPNFAPVIAPLQGEQVACTRSQPGLTDFTSGSWTRLEGRFQCVIGATPMRALRPCLWNGYITASSPTFGEVNGYGARHLESLYAEPNGTATAQLVTWNNGSSSLDQQPGDYNCADLLDASKFGVSQFNAGSVVWFRFNWTKSASDHWINGYTTGISGEGQFVSTAATSQANGTGAMTLPSGGSSSYGVPRDDIIFGVPANTTRDTPICIIGDSIDYGLQDAADNGSTAGGGPHVRAIRSSTVTTPRGGKQIPYVKMARSSDQASGWVLSASSHRARELNFRGCRVLIEGYGTNDANTGGFSAEQIYRFKQAIWRSARAQGVRWVMARPMLAITSGTWTSQADGQQTSNPRSVSGGTFDQLDALLAGSAGTKSGPDVFMQNFRDAVICRDSSNNRIWCAPSGVAQTNDGTHPNSAGNPNVAAGEAPYIAAIPAWVGSSYMSPSP